MIYTVTFNPALDYLIYVTDLQSNDINRTEKEQLFYGGKGHKCFSNSYTARNRK